MTQLPLEAQSLIQAGVERMDQGLCISDSDLNLIAWNSTFTNLLRFPEERLGDRPSLRDFIRWTAESGLYGPGDAEAYFQKRMDLIAEGGDLRFTLKHDDGVVLQVKAYPLPDGGRVIFSEDITERLAKEAQLCRQSEIVDGIREAVCVTEFDGIITDWNKAATRLWGYSGDEVLGMHHEFLLATGEELTPEGEITETIRTYGNFERDMRFKRKSGEVFIGSVSVSLRRDQDNKRCRFINCVRDITARRDGERRAAETRNRFAAFMEHIPAVATIKDAEGRLVYANENFKKLRGGSGGWYGKTGTELLGERAGGQIEKSDREVIDSGMVYQRETEIDLADGSRTYLITKFPILDPDGEVLIGGLAMDLTESKKTERTIRESEERYRTVLDSAADAIFTIDQRGRIESVNKSAEAMFGHDADKLLGKNISVLMTDFDRLSHQDYVDAYLETGRGKILGVGPRELMGRRKDGTELPIGLSVNAMELSGGQYFVGVIRDLTERKKIEQQLEQAQKMEAIGQLTGGIAHDFNNLLAVVLGNVEMARERLGENERVQPLLDMILQAGERGADLTQRLLAFSRQQVLSPAVIDLNDVLKDTADLLERTLGEHIEITCTLGADLWRCLADRSQIENAILNLALNARDAMPDGGRLSLETSNAPLNDKYAAAQAEVKPGEYVMLAVTDTGEGIPPENQKHIFEPFFTTKTVGEGSGLGLSMVYGFVKQSGGHITVYSEVGEGTTFKIYMPRTEKELIEQSPSKEAGDDHVVREATILVVEDDPDVRTLAVVLLSDMGYQVMEAGSGPAALELLGQGSHIDLLLTDVVLPGGMTGPALATEVRKDRPGTRVLFMSGYAAQAMASADRREGDEAFLQKPFSRRGLLDKVREVLTT